MAKDDRNRTKPGEKPTGKFHYNPGNMSSKTVKVGEAGEVESEQQKPRDLERDRERPPSE
jgi:hypothetical protein